MREEGGGNIHASPPTPAPCKDDFLIGQVSSEKKK